MFHELPDFMHRRNSMSWRLLGWSPWGRGMRGDMLSDELMRRVLDWEARERDPELLGELRALLAPGHEDELFDAFYRSLSFGTAGIRGVMGVGTNRMNVHVVAQAMQGLADWVNANAEPGKCPRVALCRDTRNNSERFERVAAEVFAANGIEVLMYPRVEPVPTLSFAIPRLGCSAGVMVTSSHNPRQYNGCKVFASDGCQISGEVAEEVATAIGRIDVLDGPRRLPFEDCLAQGLVSWIDDSVLDDFLACVHALHVPGSIDPARPPRVVYTPLNGTGLELVRRSLASIGVSDVSVVPEQVEPDGDFTTCPYPNPEFREALELALSLADKLHPDLVVATDPDADRLGSAVLHDGRYVLLTGDEVGILLMDWMARTRAEAGDDLSRKVAVSSIVSSDMLDDVAREHGFQLRRTLTGFKNIGGQIAVLERQGGAERWLMGYEESYGYLPGPYVRDKDGVTALTLLVEMAGWYAKGGLDLVEAMDVLYERHGFHLNRTLNLQYPGAEGATLMASKMRALREGAPRDIAGRGVTRTVDYLHPQPLPQLGGPGDDRSQTLPASDVLEWRLDDGCKVMVRPSGTEPKLKCYLFGIAGSRDESTRALDELEAATRQLLGA